LIHAEINRTIFSPFYHYLSIFRS